MIFLRGLYLVVLLTLFVISNCGESSVIFQTNIYFESGIPTQVLSICAGQRPEDAIDDFIGLFEFETDKLKWETTDYITSSLCDYLQTTTLPCTSRRPSDIVAYIDVSHIGYPGGRMKVRADVDTTSQIDCVCSFGHCSEDTQLQLRKIIESETADFLPDISNAGSTKDLEDHDGMESQFASSDLYEVLGFTDRGSVSENDVKRRYRDLAKKFHPDKNPNRIQWATKAFQNITRAYETLVDAGRRRDYDTGRVAGQETYNTASTHSESFHFSAGNGFAFTFTFGF